MISVYKKWIAAAGGKPLGTCLLLLLIFQSLFVLAQTNVQVSGTVTGDTGDPLSGVSVRSADGSASTSTDDSGQFTVQVPANSVLVISYLGYTPQDINVCADDQQVTVTLQPEASSLVEVVVVGYGTHRREAVTGSVTSISGNVLREVQSAKFSRALQG